MTVHTFGSETHGYSKNIDFCNINFSEGMKDSMKSLLMVSLN